jgi:hypothetical protein
MVYAMRVDQIVSLRDYDRLAPNYWPSRIPKLSSQIATHRLGDCIYDFSGGAPVQRPGVHGPKNIRTDLSGQNALISRHYFYFGSNALALPNRLLGIIHQTQSHKVHANTPLVQPFIDWLYAFGLEPNHLYGWPDYEPNWRKLPKDGCAARC